jgi:ribosomal protein L7/L12
MGIRMTRNETVLAGFVAAVGIALIALGFVVRQYTLLVVGVLETALVLLYVTTRAQAAESRRARAVHVRELLETPLPEDLQSELRRLVEARQLIPAIKVLREATGLGLRDAKDYVDDLAADLRA